MVLVPVLLSISPWELLRRLFRLGMLSCGRGTLEWVRAPAPVLPTLSPRAVRLMRSSRISAW